MTPDQSQSMPPLQAVDNFVINDSKRVERITNRGEAAYRSRPGHARRKEIKIDKLDTIDDIINVVGDRLDKAEVSFDPANETCFIPRASFDEILTPEVIAQVVNQLACYREMKPDERAQVAGDIYYGQDSSPTAHGPCRKLLATLIGVQGGAGGLETVEEIKRHMEEGMSDDCLPLLFDNAGLLICRLHGHGHPFINHKRPRGARWRKDFMYWSRTLMVPYIMWGEGPENLHRHYVMYGGGPLPMEPVSKSPGPHVRHGGYGDVLKVKIHDGDRNFQGSRGQGSFFALKRLKENGEAARIEFDLEVRSLIFTENRANSVPGPNDTETKKHVIQLLASFEVHNSNSEHPTYYLLFPWADGNLEGFWKQQDGAYSPRNQVQTGWMIDQFYHLAKALQCLHNDRKTVLSQRTDSNRYGRHGDIKPGNFLFFCDSSYPGFELVLADFSLGRLHSKVSKSMQPPNVSRTATYAAPEYDIEGGLLSPRSDIFSLGCVLLEHMVWLFDGFAAVEVFTDERMSQGYYSSFETDTFWEVSGTDRTSAKIKDKVSERLTTLKNHDDCVEVIGEILEVIEKKMLQPRPGDRYASEDLVHELNRIRGKWARRDSDYGTRAWKDRGAIPDHGISESTSGDSDRDSVTNPGYAESLFSTTLAAPSVTSIGSKWEDVVRSAKAEMVAFFLADAELRPLFVAAIEDPSIGGDRLERNFRRLLVDYSTDILATTDIKRIYQDVAKLLRSEGLFISQQVRRNFDPFPVESSGISSASLMKIKHDGELFEKGGPMMDRFLETMPQHNAGSDDAGPEPSAEARPEPDTGLRNKAEVEQGEPSGKASAEPDNDEASILPALDEIKEFLSSGTHMNNLRTGLRNFVTPRVKQSEEQSVAKSDVERPSESETTRTVSEPESSVQDIPFATFPRSLPHLVDYLFDFLPLPCWEPPVPPGKGRVRWKCQCGASLYDDFVELEPGSLKELETELRTANNGGFQPGNQPTWSVTRIWSASGNLMRQMANSLRRVSANDDISLLPVQNGPGPHQTSNLETSETYIRYLLCCMPSGETGTKLHQERIFRQLKDRELGILLTEVYQKRKSLLSWLNLRHVSKLHLTRFDVDFSSFVQVHLHKACDVTDCICLPTPAHIACGEYCCEPAPKTKPTRVPVLGENYLMHFFKHPELVRKDQEVIFNQLPKRSWGQLAAPHDKLELGWGLYFEEGWHWRSIYFIFAVPVVAGSLAFGIAWSVLKTDIQGGFTITGVWITVGSLAVGYMALRSL